MHPIVPESSAFVNENLTDKGNSWPPAPPASVPPPPTAPIPPTFNYAGHPFVEQLKAEKKFFVYKLTPSVKPGKKWDKKPLLPVGFTSDDFVYAEEAIRRLAMFGPGHCLGYYFTEDSKRFFYDLDGCRRPETNELTQIAHEAMAIFRGSYMEVSVSGEGVHVVSSYQGERPKHGCRNDEKGLELYTAGRGMAIGTPYAETGSVNADCTEFLKYLTAVYFPPSETSANPAEWSEGPCEGSNPIQDDSELIRRARQSGNADQRFGDKASFEDLWTANEQKLGASYPDISGRAYDASKADAGLAQRLAWWTGNDCDRIERLMRQSALVRDKWDTRRGSITWLQKTILFAVSRQTDVYGEHDEAIYIPADKGQRASDSGRSLTVPDGTPNELTPEDFWAHLPSHKYINRYTRETYSADAINGHLKRFTNGGCQGMKPSLWLDQFRAVHQMSWHPGQPEILEGMRSDNGVLKPEPTGRIFNRYRESDAVGSDADASIWVNHIKRIYPTDADYIIQWFAYRVQNPGVKINHALVLGSIQGTGKDWMLKPLRYALGPSNVATVKPTELFSQFNDWVESTLLIINEARDLGEENRFTFYETTKPLIAGPPDTLRCNLKGITPYSVPNVMAVVITTNNKLSGLYLPPDDRRHYVTWSPADRPSKEYFDHLWDWMDNRGGQQAVVGYLKRLDVSGFGAQADPPKTEAWHQVVAASINPDELSLSDAIEGIQVATVKEIITTLQLKGYMELADSLRKSPRKIPHILETAGFEVLPNPYAKGDGRWRLIDGRKDTLYVDRKLPLNQRLELANAKSRSGH